jgi:hypothetical protein
MLLEARADRRWQPQHECRPGRSGGDELERAAHARGKLAADREAQAEAAAPARRAAALEALEDQLALRARDPSA